MKIRTVLHPLALLAVLAAPGPALAQISLPDTPHAEGIAREVLEWQWCGEIFLLETQSLERDGEPERAAAYRADVGWLRITALNQLRLAGVESRRAAALRADYEQTAHWQLDGDAYDGAFHECDGAFKGVGADGLPGILPASPRGSPSEDDGAAAPEIGGVTEALPALAPPGLLDAYAAWRDLDYETALSIWERLAAQGDADAAFMLAESHLSGTGIDADRTHALDWYRRAAERGHSEAQFALGEQHALEGQRLWPGADAERSFAAAAHWFGIAADAGHAPARHMLGRMALNGTGLPENPEMTRRLWTLAAAQGFRESYEVLPLFGYEVPEDIQDLWTRYDTLMTTGTRPGQTLFPTLLRPLAESGHMLAQFTLGALYFSRPDQMSDPAEAERWLRAAQLQGDRRAYHMLMSLALARAGLDPAD